jgi:hypothetical protein
MKILFTLLGLISITSLLAQNVRFVNDIPAGLEENSGMLIGDANRIWLHNDSGDSSKLYAIDTNQNITKTILLTNASSFDWEDITYDQQGNAYVADIGNNSNNRQDLRIWKIPHPDSITGNTTTAEEIRFYYPEQTAFPAPDVDKNYDAEALIYLNDSLYIFTKDRTNPHQGFSRLYQIPADTGYHAAILLDSFQTNQLNVIFEITAAAISPSQDKVALLNANSIWVFSNFTGSNFFGGTVQNYPLGGTTQKEALDFLNDSTIYYSNENSFLGSAKLHELSLPVAPILSLEKNVPSTLPSFVYPNPTQHHLNIDMELPKAGRLQICLLNMQGQKVQQLRNEWTSAGKQTFQFGLQKMPAGIYMVNIRAGKYKVMKRLVLMD